MTQAVAYSEQQNGQQSQSSGLIIHRGPLSAAVIQAIGAPATGQAVWPRSGPGAIGGLEFVHTPHQNGLIQSYDRETDQYLDLYVNAKYIIMQPQAGGKIIMPAGTAQALLGNYMTSVNWGIPQTNVWVETPVQLTVTFTGAPLRFEWSVVVSSPSAGAAIYIGLGLNGAITWPSMAQTHVPVANFTVSMSGVLYHMAPTPGPTRVSLFMYANTASSITPTANNTLWVTEQRA